MFCAVTDVDSSVSGTNLVKKAIYAMVEGDCDEVRYIHPFPLEDFLIASHFFLLKKNIFSYTQIISKFLRKA